MVKIQSVGVIIFSHMLRLRLRGLVPFLDKKKHKIVYTDFKDEVMGVREEAAVYMPKMTGTQYEKKVKDYLRNHLDHIVIHRLRTNQPVTETDLQGLETILQEIGEHDGEQLPPKKRDRRIKAANVTLERIL